jgi:hypothetical protein
MSTTTRAIPEEPFYAGAVEPEKKSAAVAGAGASAEVVLAAVAIVLAVVGLARIAPRSMMSVATILLGAALLLDAVAVGARHRHLVRESVGADERTIRAVLTGAISAGSVAGLAGIVLGILALAGLAPGRLCAVALIGFGVALLFGSPSKELLALQYTAPWGMRIAMREAIDEVLDVTAAGDVLVGLAAIVLGVIGLLAATPAIPVLIGFIGVGTLALLAGAAYGARMGGLLLHAR